MTDEVGNWRTVGVRLGIEVIAPARVMVGGEPVTFTALLPQFGAPNGMLADANWEAIEPYANAVCDQGYGFSCVTIGDGSGAQEVLRDWGWAASEPKPSWW